MLEAAPFIIWTLRRTGGTNLSHALFGRSPFEKSQHEPFNPERQFGQITRDWLASKDLPALRRSVAEVCQRRVVMKHCVEIIPAELNTALADAAIEQGYRHLFLYRRNSLDRLMSLHFASQSGIWGKDQAKDGKIDDELFRQPIPIAKLVAHETHCRNELTRVYNYLCEKGQAPLLVAFEDLYLNPNPGEARRQVGETLKALAMTRTVLVDQQFISDILTTGDQGTRNQYSRFDDYEKFVNAINTLGDYDVTAGLTADIQLTPVAGEFAPLVQIWAPRRDVKAGSTVIEGLVMLPSSLDLSSYRLTIVDANGEQEVEWRLASPKLATQHPGNPNANSARFFAQGIKLAPFSACQLLLVSADGNRQELARIGSSASGHPRTP